MWVLAYKMQSASPERGEKHTPCWQPRDLNPCPWRGAGALKPFGWEGWRLAILLLGIISFTTGVLNFWLSKDPRCPSDGLRLEKAEHAEESVNVQEFWQELKSVLSVPTFVIIVCQVGPCVLQDPYHCADL